MALCEICACSPLLKVEKKGTYFYWFDYTDGLGGKHVTQPVKFKGDTAKLDTSALGTTFKSAKLFVMNKKTGNLAILDYTPAKDQKQAKEIALKDDAFSYVRNVRLRVIAEDGSPIESALVEITDGEGTPMAAVITPADNGIATFQNVAAGEVNVKVRAKGVTKTVDSDIEVPTKRATPWFEKDVRVKGDVDTIPAETVVSPETKTAKAESTTAGRQASRVDLALQMLAGILLLVIIVAIIYAVAKAKGATAEQALRKLGVQLPDTATGTPQAGTVGTGPTPSSTDASVCPFCGQKRDALGNCACSLQPSVATPQTTAAAAPRLVGLTGTYAGQVFTLGPGTKLIGREPECDVALVNDNTTSRRHATITVSADGYTIRDEGSSNGTFVNGVRIQEHKLSPGDEIQIGATRFRFEA
ncbi:MAG: FHA domain-containing protein [Armatimonadota bacterium]|nr:FHA domain-containing protein [Armatimonadota bacterium]